MMCFAVFVYLFCDGTGTGRCCNFFLSHNYVSNAVECVENLNKLGLNTDLKDVFLVLALNNLQREVKKLYC